MVTAGANRRAGELAPPLTPSSVRAFLLRVSAPPSNGLVAVPFCPTTGLFFFQMPHSGDAHLD
jgi:hypothetical protein